MVLNTYENTIIKNSDLPEGWQYQESLDEFSDFLQQNWEQRSIFYEDGSVNSRQQFLTFLANQRIKTKNYVGTIVFKGEQLNIYPKMFRTDADDTDVEHLNQKHLMSNIIKWIEYCNKMAYPFISISSKLDDSEDLRELFITLYIGYVRKALERGAYYQYIEKTENRTSIKGKFDLKDYILDKIPKLKTDKFKCTYSEFEFDNIVNRIIKCTCKLIYNWTSKKNQGIIRSILMRLNEVSDVSCDINDCNIRLSKMHRHYSVILSMSKMFLLNKMSNYSIDINQSFCFLFPTELLFEGFIGGFIREVIGDYGGKVYLQKSDMDLIDDVIYRGESLGSAFKMRHDILVELNDKVFVLDTKYKQISRFEGNPDEIRRIVSEEPTQADIYQVCEYARKRNIKDVYLLYPLYRYEDPESEFPVGISRADSGDIKVHFMRIPFIFEDNEEETKRCLRIVIEGIFILE